jgi:hypothetical protein
MTAQFAEAHASGADTIKPTTMRTAMLTNRALRIVS